MFLKNRTAHRAILRRGHLNDELAAAAVILQALFEVTPEGTLAPRPARAPAPGDPPDTAQHLLWHGVSVTATGTVAGPARPPYRADVALRVGTECRALAVFGPRVWVSGQRGAPVPSAARPFQSLTLDYAHAFGGAFDLPPGPLPQTGLPHPGGHIEEPRNPGGVGFYRDAASALGQPLPRIEWADSVIQDVSDRPEPAGFAPCPHLEGLRFSATWLSSLPPHPVVPGSSLFSALEATESPALPEMLARVAHHAHGRLIFDRIDPGTPIALSGLGAAPLAFAAPDLRLSVFFARAGGEASGPEKRLRLALRGIHLDGDRREVLFTFGATGTYPIARPPIWVVATIAGERAEEARG